MAVSLSSSQKKGNACQHTVVSKHVVGEYLKYRGTEDI